MKQIAKGKRSSDEVTCVNDGFREVNVGFRGVNDGGEMGSLFLHVVHSILVGPRGYGPNNLGVPEFSPGRYIPSI
jgi:hypothetical protein